MPLGYHRITKGKIIFSKEEAVMGGKERVLTIRLLEKLNKNRDYAESIGITILKTPKHKNKE